MIEMEYADGGNLAEFLMKQTVRIEEKDILGEPFYYVNYGSSIITTKVSQIISVMKTQTLLFLLSSRHDLN